MNNIVIGPAVRAALLFLIFAASAVPVSAADTGNVIPDSDTVSEQPDLESSAIRDEEGHAKSVSSGTGLGQFEQYTNVLGTDEGAAVVEYMPLAKGNSWTYSVKTGEETKEVTNVIISETDGWSVFDKFFGISWVGMKIAPGGEIMVTYKSGTQSFYNSEVVTEFSETAVATPAGKFGEVMVVSNPEGGKFWFRDVYAKGVGLVFHEQRSPAGDIEYNLVEATVGGKKYPPEK